ncbi:unnamed protein product, partial [Ectocarpus sp. 12 AP-2014]
EGRRGEGGHIDTSTQRIEEAQCGKTDYSMLQAVCFSTSRPPPTREHVFHLECQCSLEYGFSLAVYLWHLGGGIVLLGCVGDVSLVSESLQG